MSAVEGSPERQVAVPAQTSSPRGDASPTDEHGPGPLALVGGAEWQPGCSFDADLLESSGGEDVLILPTAAAYERPDKAVEFAQGWFSSLGARASGLMVLNRSDAEDARNADVVRRARFIYLGGGSPLHLRAVLKASAVWQALLEAWRSGAVVAGSSAGAMVLGDPMVDPRGGAFTLGLGLLENVAVLPHASTWSHDRLRRTTHLASKSVALLTVDEKTAAIRGRDGTWTVAGAGRADVFLDGRSASLDALPG